MVTTLSRYFGVKPQELIKRGVLNAHLGIDNRLFVDPNLVGLTKIPEFQDARDDLKAYFRAVIKLLEKSQRKGDLTWSEAKSAFESERNMARPSVTLMPAAMGGR